MGDYKLVLNWEGPWKVRKYELFNLNQDIGKTKDLSNIIPDKTKEMANALVDYLHNVNAETAQQTKQQIKSTNVDEEN